MNSVAERPTETAEASVSHMSSVPQHIIAAFREALIRDGRTAAIQVIAGRGYPIQEVAAAVQRTYGEQDEIR